MKRVTHFELVVRVPFPCVGLGVLPPLAPEPHVAMATRRTTDRRVTTSSKSYANMITVHALVCAPRDPDFVYASSIYNHDDYMNKWACPSPSRLVDTALNVPTYAYAVTHTAELGAEMIPKSYYQALRSPQATYLLARRHH